MFEVIKLAIKPYLDRLKERDCGLMEGVQIVMTIVIMLIVGVIGLFIGDKVLSVSTTSGNFSDANLTAAKNSLTSTVSTGFSFLVILVVAAIGGIALLYVMRYMGQFFTNRSGGGGGAM